jgi:hypothetical protein
MRQRLIEVVLKDGKIQWQRLENMIGIARSEGSFDLLPTAQMGLQFLMSTEGQFLRNKLVMALTEDDQLHLHEVQHIWKLLQVELQPTNFLNVAISAITNLSSSMLKSR